MIPRSALVVLGTALILAVSLLTACTHGRQAPAGMTISRYADLQPDKLTLDRCELDLAGMKFNADMRVSTKGEVLRIDLVANGQVYESERYGSSEKGFGVLDAGDEVYDPPIPLVSYPMTVGEPTPEWRGAIMTGEQPHAATAKISTTTDSLVVRGQTVHDVVRVQVDLFIDSGITGHPATRTMVFWIAPKMGVVKRAFGDYSERKPPEAR